MLKRILSGALFVLWCSHPTMARAQTPREQASALTHQLMSPFCPGLLLADCRSEGARQLRAEIDRRLDGGELPERVADDLVARFGPTIRGAPEFNGVGVIAWICPALIGFGGLLALAGSLRRMTIASATHTQTPLEISVDGELELRIDDELDALN
jgi:cytochrome c-type biogenesis protein CcmH/NrfF